jgi:hypothetical protein
LLSLQPPSPSQSPIVENNNPNAFYKLIAMYAASLQKSNNHDK